MTGCGGGRPPLGTGEPPRWSFPSPDEYGPPDKLYAVGVCAYKDSPERTTKGAQSDARVKMTIGVRSNIKQMMDDWIAGSGELADPGSQRAGQLAEDVSREATEAVLDSATEIRRWTSPKGDVYLLYELRRDDSFMGAVKAEAAKALQQQPSQLLKHDTGRALANLDQYLAEDLETQTEEPRAIEGMRWHDDAPPR